MGEPLISAVFDVDITATTSIVNAPSLAPTLAG